jgi:hypothetical protein
MSNNGNRATKQAVLTTQEEIDANQVLEKFALFNEQGDNVLAATTETIINLLGQLEDLADRVEALENA